jgi:hypothetical protein
MMPSHLCGLCRQHTAFADLPRTFHVRSVLSLTDDPYGGFGRREHHHACKPVTQ